jgi:hypothetical protein
MITDFKRRILILRAIIQGWTNVVFLDPGMEKTARERAKICAGCPNANPEYKFKKWFPEEKRIEEAVGLGCDLCGCPIAARVRQTLLSCPDSPKRW